MANLRMASSKQSDDFNLQNFVQCFVALHYTKGGLEEFVWDEIKQFQTDILTGILKTIGLPAGSKCNSCTTANILPCPTVGICASSGRCKVHHAKDPARKADTPCNICKALRDKIRWEHRYYLPYKSEPSWKNADATKFCSDPFQILKCFMPVDGYSSVQSIKDTDFNGIINVIINCKRYQNKLSAKVFQKANVFVEARDIGRNLRHSSTLSVSDTDLAKHIDTLIQILSDPKYLGGHCKAQDAVTKLRKLKNNGLKGILQSEEDIKRLANSLHSFIDSIEKISDETRKKLQGALQSHEEVQKTVKQMTKSVRYSVKRVERASLHAKKQIGNLAKKTIIYVRKCTSEINNITDQSAEMNARHHAQNDVLHNGYAFRRLLQDLRKDLLLYYDSIYDTITLPNLTEEYEVSLSTIFVRQNLQSSALKRDFNRLRDTPDQTYIKSYKDLFYNGSTEYTNIYITSKAGSGKTFLSKWICYLWCKAHTSETCMKQEKEDIEKENIDVLRQFEFVFMLPLDESDHCICDVDEMIEKQIIYKLSKKTHYSKHFLTDVLHNYKCLVILDGLDKWTHPKTCTSTCKTDLIPKRPIRPLCTIMTTSCQWRFNALNLKVKQIDRHVDICDLDEMSSRALITKAVNFLNDKTKYKMTASEIQKKIFSSKIDELRYNPNLILQLVCHLYKGHPIGNTKCEQYTTIVNLMLTRCQHTEEFSLKYCPSCLLCHAECKKKFGLLLSIGKVAFWKLLGDYSSSDLEKITVHEYMTNETLAVCFSLGILTQIKSPTHVLSREIMYTFCHKTFQIYFAALFAQSKHDESILKKIKQLIVSNFQRVSDDSNMFDFCTFVHGFNPSFFNEMFYDEIFNFRNNSSIVKSADKQCNAVRCYQSLVIKCLKESSSPDENELPLPLSDIIIDFVVNSDDDIKVLIQHDEKYDGHLISLCIRGYASYCNVTNVIQTLDVNKMRNLTKIELRGIPVDFILQALLKNSKDTLHCLDLCSFEYEKIYRNKPMKFKPEHMNVISGMKQLQVLTLASFIMNHDDIDLLFQLLNEKKEMRHIVLYCVECSHRQQQKCKGHILDLSIHGNLRVFGLDHVPVSKLKLNPLNIEECWIGRLSSSVLKQLFTDIQRSYKLQTLYCLKHDDICLMLEALPNLSNISYIHFRHINFGNRVASLNSKSLKFIELNGVVISSTALRLMLDTIEELRHEVDISFENVTVNPKEDFETIKQILQRSPDFTVVLDGLNAQKQRLLKFRKVLTNDACIDKRQGKAFITSSINI